MSRYSPVIIRALALGLLGFGLMFGAPPGISAENVAEVPHTFVADGRLKRNVDFWVSIYSQYESDKGVIHDSKYVDIVYEVVNLNRSGTRAATAQNFLLIRKSKQRWQSALMGVHRKITEPATWTDDERRVFELLGNVHEPDKFLKAAHRKRIRFQLGQKDRFREGLIASGKYLPKMEEIFRREGLPIELTRLPFVESSFNTRARSKVGASGIWQFMRSTGKLFLRIDDAVDERNDPIRATEAAARLLRENYESLGKWPLAVTAYNFGRKGMMKAVRLAGTTDFENIMQTYSARTFGFASGNFYCELLAAIEVEKNAEKHFGKLEREKAIEYIEVRIPDYMDIRDLAQLLKFDLKQLRQLNPGLSDWVYSGVRLIPAGYRLRLPYDTAGESLISPEAASRLFFAGYSAIPDVYKLRTQLKGKQPRKRLLSLTGK